MADPLRIRLLDEPANTDYLLQAILNLKQALLALVDDEDAPIFRHVQEYLFPSPSAFPAVCFNVGGVLINAADDISAEWERNTYFITLRVLLGQLGSGYTGQTESSLWTWIPALVSYLNRYSDMQYTPAQPMVEEIAPPGAYVNTVTRVGTIQSGDDGRSLWGFEIQLSVPIHVYNEKQWST